MKKLTWSIGMVAVLVFCLIIPSAFAGSSEDEGYSPEMQAKIKEMKKELKKFTDERALTAKHLKTFVTCPKYLYHMLS